VEITQIKHWSKVVQNENVDHVTISYTDNGSDVTKHEFGNNSTAAPEFYNDFENLSEFVCKITGLSKDYESAIAVREVKIAISEDNDGNDNTKYTLIATFKSGHAITVLNVQINHKYIPEGFDEAIQNLINEAEEYICGKRAQVEMDLESSDEQEEQAEQDPSGETDPDNYELESADEDNEDEEYVVNGEAF